MSASIVGERETKGSTAACVAKVALLSLAGALVIGSVVLLCVALASCAPAGTGCGCAQCPTNGGGRCTNPGCQAFVPLLEDGEGVYGQFQPAHAGHLAQEPNALGQQAGSCGEARNVPLYAQSGVRFPWMSGWRHDLGQIDSIVREDTREQRLEGILFGPKSADHIAAQSPLASAQQQRGGSCPYEARADPARVAELRAEFARGIGDRLDEAQRQLPSATIGGVHFDANHLQQRLSTLNRAWAVKDPEIPRWKRAYADHLRGDALVPANTWTMFRPERNDPSELQTSVLGQVIGESLDAPPPWATTLQVSAADVACYADRVGCGDDTMGGGAAQPAPVRFM